MNAIKRLVQLLIKMAIIVVFPYYFVNSSTRTTSINNIVGTWGQWPQEIFTPPFSDVFWESYQIIFALVFIIPLAIFAFVYHEKEVDRKCIASALAAITISYITTYLFTPQYGYISLRWSLFNVVPNVVSLGIFVFIFWPLLHNVWPPSDAPRKDDDDETTMKKLRAVIEKVVPLNAATAVWIALIIIPAAFTVNNLNITETSTTYILTLAGGLYNLQHDYMYVIGGGYYPTIYSYTFFITAGWMSISGLFVWILNVFTGIAVFWFIQGKTTKKRVYTLMLVSFLIIAVPSLLTIYFAAKTIPLPIFQVFMFFVMKYVRVPTIDDRIKVPLRIRISSMLGRRKAAQVEEEHTVEIEEQPHNEDL